MPQLDTSSYFSQLFWMLVCFCCLWALLSTFVIPKIADAMEQRKRKIDEYIQKADANADQLVNVNLVEKLRVKPASNAFLLIRLKQLCKEKKFAYEFPTEIISDIPGDMGGDPFGAPGNNPYAGDFNPYASTQQGNNPYAPPQGTNGPNPYGPQNDMNMNNNNPYNAFDNNNSNPYASNNSNPYGNNNMQNNPFENNNNQNNGNDGGNPYQ